MLSAIREFFDENPWKPVSVYALAGWTAFYLAFLAYAYGNTSGFLFIDNVNLPIHEGGHLLFGWGGEFLGVLGGTLLQWLVPFLLASYFFYQRQTTAFVFCLFFFFENWLYTATYMADARAQALPLVSVGGGDEVTHDWFYLFSHWGVLAHDTQIAHSVRMLGWIGMLACVLFLAWRFQRDRSMAAAK